MKKLGLCVRYDCDNYGSMLQIYATQEIIKRMGWNYEIILYDKKTPIFMIKNITRLFNPYFLNDKLMIFKKKIKLKRYKDVELENQVRANRFSEYRKKYIGPYSHVYKGYKNLNIGAQNYDAVMVGSDQLWTPAGIKSKFYNLIFVPNDIRKISFATSFGVNNIPNSQRRMTSYYLNRIDYLSVREINAQRIVKDLTGKESVIALDPTLVLSGSEWGKIFPKKQIIDGPYIFAYFLGTNPMHRDVVKRLGEKTHLKIVTCPHMDDFVECDLTFGDKQLYDIDPIDFLNLIRGATYICTDSFHGTVFSILNNKKFLTFNRYDSRDKQSKNSRIDSLCDLLGLEDRRFTKIEYVLENIENEIDYSSVELKLEKLRKNTISFLSEALNKG